MVGAIFSNDESLDKLNSDLVAKCFYNALQKSYGIMGTIFQKVYYVNTYLFSKIWYLAQCFKLEEKMLDKILVKALQFIYAGENERPVRCINFRHKELGGLGLIHPKLKSKAFMIKNMYSEFLSLNCSIGDLDKINRLYGYPEDFVQVYMEGLSLAPVKEIYDYLLQDTTKKNGSLIPSRSEKRSTNVKWSLVFKNLTLLKGMTAEEKEFAWKVSQDMLPVGARIHRKNVERRCLRELGSNVICEDTQTLEHLFINCTGIQVINKSIKMVLQHFMERAVENNEIIHFSFNHRNKKKLTCALWFSVKSLYNIFQNKSINKSQLLTVMIKELDWNLKLNRNVGSQCEMLRLKLSIERELNS